MKNDYKLTDLLENPDLFRDALPKQLCANEDCRVPLRGVITGKRNSPIGIVCEDCYFGLMSDEIEKHPPGSAGIRRG